MLCGSFGVPITLARKLRAPVPDGSPLILMVSGKPVWAEAMPPSCQPPRTESATRFQPEPYFRSFPNGSAYTNDAVTFWRTSKYVGPHSAFWLYRFCQ